MQTIKNKNLKRKLVAKTKTSGKSKTIIIDENHLSRVCFTKSLRPLVHPKTPTTDNDTVLIKRSVLSSSIK